MKKARLIAPLLFALGVLLTSSGAAGSASFAPLAQDDSHFFPETKRTVKGKFLKYWREHGGLPQQGYPISEEMQERSDTDGKLYMVQYFERAVFELHPENAPRNDVLLSLLGVFLYEQKKYPKGAPNQTPNNSEGSVLFKETGHRVGGKFLKYWQEHGALAQQGYPISEEFTEVSDLDGKPYKVQYFERAVFEEHPENQPPHDVLLSQLGTFRYRYKMQPTPIPATATPGRMESPTIMPNTNIKEYDLNGFKLRIDDSPSQDDHGLEVLNPAELGTMAKALDLNGKGTIQVKFITIPESSYRYSHGQTTEYGTKVLEKIIGSIRLQMFYGENDRIALIYLTQENFTRILQLQDTTQEGSLGANWIIRDAILQSIAGSGREIMDTEPFKQKAVADPFVKAAYGNRQTRLIP